MRDEQGWLRSNTAFCGVWSESALFAQAFCPNTECEYEELCFNSLRLFKKKVATLDTCN